MQFLAPVVLASCVENVWYMVDVHSNKKHLSESLWLACGAQGMKVLKPLRSGHCKTVAHRKDELSYSLNFNGLSMFYIFEYVCDSVFLDNLFFNVLYAYEFTSCRNKSLAPLTGIPRCHKWSCIQSYADAKFPSGVFPSRHGYRYFQFKKVEDLLDSYQNA